MEQEKEANRTGAFYKSKAEAESLIALHKRMLTLRVVELSSNLITKGLAVLIVVLFGALSLLIGSFAIGRYLNTLLESQFMGFFLVCGGYLFLIVILIVCRKILFDSLLRNAVIRTLFQMISEK